MIDQEHSLAEQLGGSAYPGRGIIIGRTPDNQHNLIAYFIMGRSENSRNRRFAVTEDGIRTEAVDPAKLTDPSLVIYHPVRVTEGTTIVTNGDQTDTIRDFLAAGQTYIDALRTRAFEPDAPHYTSRISAVVQQDGAYALSILKHLAEGAACQRFFYEYDTPVAGLGHFIHTYQQDSDPLPPYEGAPRCVPIAQQSAEDFAGLIWQSLNEQNKISLFVRDIDLKTGETRTIIRNKYDD